MSKIAENKALEAYPEVKYKTLGMLEGGGLIEVDLNIQNRDGYIKGYDQAMQDFKEFIYDRFNIHPHDCHVVQYDSDTPLESMDDFVKQIENYMQNEM